MVEAGLLTGDMTVPSHLWRRLVSLHEPYQPLTGLRLSEAAAAIADAIDPAAADLPRGRTTMEEMLRAYCTFARHNQQDYALAEAAGALLRRRAARAAAAGRLVADEWLALVDQLADDDDPDESLLHASAIEARCDAAVAAITCGDPPASLAHIRAAFVRSRRHRDCQSAIDYLAEAACTVGESTRRTGPGKLASEAACLAWLAARTASQDSARETAQRLLRESSADRQKAAQRLRDAHVLSFTDQQALSAQLEGLGGVARSGWRRRLRPKSG